MQGDDVVRKCVWCGCIACKCHLGYLWRYGFLIVWFGWPWWWAILHLGRLLRCFGILGVFLLFVGCYWDIYSWVGYVTTFSLTLSTYALIIGGDNQCNHKQNKGNLMGMHEKHRKVEARRVGSGWVKRRVKLGRLGIFLELEMAIFISAIVYWMTHICNIWH